MSDLALKIHSLNKWFRVRHVPDTGDPRREPQGRHHDRFHALSNIHLDIPRGQTLGLIGPNGSGKSTLLKILAGVMRPGSGTIETHGTVGALLELGAGFHPDLTGLENVYLNGALLGMRQREIDSILPDIIAFAQLEHFMDMPVRHYSSGMTARLGFAVATRLANDIVLMDETLSTGDAQFMARALGHIAALKAQGRTMILVSHNMEMILQLADRAVWLSQGLIHRDGPPRPVLAEYRRSQRIGYEENYRMRNTLGLDSAFEGALAPGPPLAIGAVRLVNRQSGQAVSGAPDALLDIELGQSLGIELKLKHPQGAPDRLYIETAWSSDEDRILAQSRTAIQPRRYENETRVTLDFAPWRLNEGRWRLALAVSPAKDVAAENTLAAPVAPVYYTRTTEAGAVRTVTPNDWFLPITTPIPTCWQVD